MTLRRLILPMALMFGIASAPAFAQDRGCASVTERTCQVAHSLKRGINLGNMLDAPREGDWGAKLEPAYIDAVAGKFSTVRIPVRFSNHAAPTADATIDPAFFARVDRAVDAALGKGLYVMLDLHHYTQITGDAQHPHEFAVDPAVLDERLLNMWRQIATHYKDRPSKLMFELLNEPHGRLDADAWNSLAARTLAVVRESNPTRIVFIGPVEWNSVRELSKLRLPPDRNIIVAVHNYDPFNFTHQGVEWLPQHFPAGTPCCNATQRREIATSLDIAKRWSDAHGYPVHLGEFGTYQKADMQSRAAYARTVRDEAEKRGIGWAYWNFASDFGAWNTETNQWIEPLRHALLD